MITQKRLKEVLHYNHETGVFTWVNPSANRLSVGDVAGCITTFPHNNKSYHHIRIDRILYRSHRLAWIYMYGDIDKTLQIDHINNDGTDNRIKNLRLVAASDNAKNKRRYNNNKSGHTGVYKIGSRWRATIGCDGKRIHIGMYDTIEQAIKAREDRKRDLGFMRGHGL